MLPELLLPQQQLPRGPPAKSAAVKDHVARSASVAAVSDTTCESAGGTEAAATDVTAANPTAYCRNNRFGSCVIQRLEAAEMLLTHSIPA